jgi:hypothetical protein
VGGNFWCRRSLFLWVEGRFSNAELVEKLAMEPCQWSKCASIRGAALLVKLPPEHQGVCSTRPEGSGYLLRMMAGPRLLRTHSVMQRPLEAPPPAPTHSAAGASTVGTACNWPWLAGLGHEVHKRVLAEFWGKSSVAMAFIGQSMTVTTLIIMRIIRLNVLVLNYLCSTLCQNIGVGKFALMRALLHAQQPTGRALLLRSPVRRHMNVIQLAA